MSAPTNPRFFEHCLKLDIVRRRSVYRPEVPGDEIQRHLQMLIEAMTLDGYSPEVIRAVFIRSAQLAVVEAGNRNCNKHRARFFHDLIELELGI